MKKGVNESGKRFAKINIEISNVCNLQCSFCPEVIRPKGLMNTELFRQVISQVAPLTEMVCFHLMGDPLVHPDLPRFLDICGESEVKVFLVSNGVLLNEKSISLLLHPALHQVCFSLHSFPDNFGDRDPSVYLEKIFRFTERAFIERPALYINYRLWDVKQVRGEALRSDSILERIESHFQIKISRHLDLGRHKGRVLKNRLYLHFDSQFIWPALTLPVLGERGRCHGLSTHFGILVDGTVVPCCLDKEGSIPLGNVKDSPIADILSSVRSQAMVSGFRAGRLVEALCQRCQYIERFQSQSPPLANLA